MNYMILTLTKGMDGTDKNFSAVAVVDAKHYFFDLRCTYDHGNECMGFRCNRFGVVSKWEEVFCRRGIKVNAENLKKCIADFAKGKKA